MVVQGYILCSLQITLNTMFGIVNVQITNMSIELLRGNEETVNIHFRINLSSPRTRWKIVATTNECHLYTIERLMMMMEEKLPSVEAAQLCCWSA